MRITSTMLAFVLLLFTFGCKKNREPSDTLGKQNPEAVAILLHDLNSDDQNATDKFASALALESGCKGLVLYRTGHPQINFPPKRGYWALDGWERGDKFDWSIMHRSPDSSLINGSDESAAIAAKHVCTILKQNGGEVR